MMQVQWRNCSPEALTVLLMSAPGAGAPALALSVLLLSAPGAGAPALRRCYY